MIKLLLLHGNRLGLPHTTLRREVKRILDTQWSRLGLGRRVSEVVPFLPLEPEHVQQVGEAVIIMPSDALLLVLSRVVDSSVVMCYYDCLNQLMSKAKL